MTKSSPRRHFPPLQATISVHHGTNGEWRPLWSDVGWEFDYIVSLFVSAVCLLFPQPSECEQCTCDSDGIARCLVADCAPPPCVNPVYQPGKCCPECQDGTWQITSGAFCYEQCSATVQGAIYLGAHESPQKSRPGCTRLLSLVTPWPPIFLFIFFVGRGVVGSPRARTASADNKENTQCVEGSMLSSFSGLDF